MLMNLKTAGYGKVCILMRCSILMICCILMRCSILMRFSILMRCSILMSSILMRCSILMRWRILQQKCVEEALLMRTHISEEKQHISVEKVHVPYLEPALVAQLNVRLTGIRRSWVQPPPRSAEFCRGDLSWNIFLRSFSPICWFKKGSCQFLAKECAQY